MKNLHISFLCLAMFFFGCKKGGGESQAPEVIDLNKPAVTNINNDLILKLVNDIRLTGCKCGSNNMPPVAALSWNNKLAISAALHSKDMETMDKLTHTSSNGNTLGDRITAVGYVWSTAGENIAFGQTTEQQVFNDWINSEDHCKNIMTATFKDMGVAKQGKYWTQDFGSAR